MAFPAGALTATITVGAPIDIAGAAGRLVSLHVRPDLPGDTPLVWATDGTPIQPWSASPAAGEAPVTSASLVILADQPGVLTSSTVNGAAEMVEIRSWPLVATWATQQWGAGAPTRHVRHFNAPAPGTTVDLDLLPADGVTVPAVITSAQTLHFGGSSAVTADDTPAAPTEGESASYLVTSAVSWPAGLVWSTDPDGGVAPTITGTALVSLFTVAGVTRAIMGATFPAVAAPDTTAPSTVTGLTATATGDTTVNLSWSAATDNIGVTGYEYRIGAGAAVDAGAGTTETVTGLTAGTTYNFTVRAYDAAGNRSDWSTSATATTTAPDTTAPVWTATLTPGTPTETAVVVAASALATDANAVTYERTLDSTAGTPAWATIVPSGLNFTLDGLTAGTVYANCALRAKDAAGNISTPVLAVPSFTTAAAAAPFSDDFNRADDATTLGSPWVARSGGTFGVSSSKAYCPTSTETNGIATVDVATANVVVEADITWATYSGVVLRYSGTTYIIVRMSSTGIGMYTASGTAIGTAHSMTPTAGTTYHIKVVANGTSLELLLDGASVSTATSTYSQTATAHGIVLRKATADRADSFTVTPV